MPTNTANMPPTGSPAVDLGRASDGFDYGLSWPLADGSTLYMPRDVLAHVERGDRFMRTLPVRPAGRR